jgi:hypothetical protein
VPALPKCCVSGTSSCRGCRGCVGASCAACSCASCSLQAEAAVRCGAGVQACTRKVRETPVNRHDCYLAFHHPIPPPPLPQPQSPYSLSFLPCLEVARNCKGCGVELNRVAYFAHTLLPPLKEGAMFATRGGITRLFTGEEKILVAVDSQHAIGWRSLACVR